MDFLTFTLVEWKFFLLVLFRVGGILATAPVFASPLFPGRAKGAFTLVLALVLFPVLPQEVERLPVNLGQYMVVLFMETTVGVVFGLAATLLFVGVQLGGQIMDHQIGFGLANVIDPITQSQQSILAQFYFLFATLLFLSSNGHHVLLRGMVDSFRIVPIGGLVFSEDWARLVTVQMVGELLVLAIRISAPVIVALLLTSVAMGFMARTVPEMNIFIIGFAIRIVFGLAVLIVVFPVIARVLVESFDVLAAELSTLLELLGGGRRP